MTWRVVLEQDPQSGDWAAWAPELPGCASAGRTRVETEEGIREAIALYLQRDPIEVAAGAVVIEVAA